MDKRPVVLIPIHNESYMRIQIERQIESIRSEIGDLLREVFVGEGYTQPEKAEGAFSARALRERGTLWVASADGHVAGVVLLVERNNPQRQIAMDGELEVHLLAVSSRYRGVGIGQALLREVIREARVRGAQRLVLSTQPSMHAAQSLYERVGFHRAPARDWKRSDGRTYLAFALDL